MSGHFDALRHALWDVERARPRAALRLGAHLLALGLMLMALARASRVIPQVVLGPIAFALVITITYAATRWLDRRPFVDLGLRVDVPRALDLGAGMIVGASAIGFVALTEQQLGVAHYTALALDPPKLARMAFVAVFFVGVAVQEEMVFRGYHLVNLTEGLAGSRGSPSRAAMIAVLVASLGFGLAHAGNDGASIVATLQVAVAGGTLLAIGFVLTGDLAYSIGLHFAWNFTQCALGMPVSGFVLSEAAILDRHVDGPEWLSGGAFGPEASAIGLAAMLAFTALSALYVRWRYGSLAVRLRVGLMPPPPASALPSGER